MAVPKPMLTEFGIHGRLGSCDIVSSTIKRTRQKPFHENFSVALVLGKQESYFLPSPSAKWHWPQIQNTEVVMRLVNMAINGHQVLFLRTLNVSYAITFNPSFIMEWEPIDLG